MPPLCYYMQACIKGAKEDKEVMADGPEEERVCMCGYGIKKKQIKKCRVQDLLSLVKSSLEKRTQFMLWYASLPFGAKQCKASTNGAGMWHKLRLNWFILIAVFWILVSIV